MNSSSYQLRRTTQNGDQLLSYPDSLPGSRELILSFCQDGSHRPVEFVFSNVKGQKAEFLVNGVIYSIGVDHLGTRIDYLYYINNQFILKPDRGQSGKVFVYFNPGQSFSIGTNIAGYVYVSGEKITQSRSIWTSLTDQYYLDSSRDMLSKDCTPNCAGKTCTERNGCGLPCGCPAGKVCQEDGSCQDKPDQTPICLDNTCGGRCYGKCNLGSLCSQINGKYSCQEIIDSSSLIGIFILLVILVIAIVVILRLSSPGDR